MFKQIPLSNISQRNFSVYKEWTVDQTTIPVTVLFNEDVLFDLDTSTTSNGLYVHPLYNSIKAKYYSANGNVFNQYGIMENPAKYTIERKFADTIYVIDIPQITYGEQIKKGSVLLEIDGVGESYKDNTFGQIISTNPTYDFISYDVENQLIIFTDGFTNFEATISSLDLETSIAIITIDGDTDSYTVIQVDFEAGTLTLSQILIFGDDFIGTNQKGNVFYDDGLIVLTAVDSFTDYTMDFRSTQTIYETEILVTAEKSEFNFSQNPSAVDVTLSGSYEFTTTKITNTSPANTVTIKEVLDISKKTDFIGSIGSTTGSWNDYYDFATTDPTGSYLTTYITTIGLFDEEQNMLAVAKLPTPIKKLPDYNLNFLVRFDL